MTATADHLTVRACAACRTLPHCECARQRAAWPPTCQPTTPEPIAQPAPASQAAGTESPPDPDLFTLEP